MERVVRWFGDNARDLPWRGADPWGVLVSEVMLQQTPVSRVVPAWIDWLDRWPRPADLALDPPSEAVRAWGGLGYPRRALRLHAAAGAIRDRHGGEVPVSADDLLALPGVGEYTAAAVRAFAFRQRAAVIDINVRRVLARWQDGQAHPPGGSAGVSERQRLLDLLPTDREQSARAGEGLMELGAVLCTARTPRCDACPLRGDCRWLATGQPAHPAPPPRQAAFAGSDRQARGAIMRLLREHRDPVEQSLIDQVWTDPDQRARAQRSLLADGLMVPAGDGYSLPTVPVSLPG